MIPNRTRSRPLKVQVSAWRRFAAAILARSEPFNESRMPIFAG
jgi:hypothetical protein